MPAKLPWFQREFAFHFSVEKYPDILERLRGAPARVEEKIKAIPPGILTRRAGDTWSIQENLGHLLDLEPLWAWASHFAGQSPLRESSGSSRHGEQRPKVCRRNGGGGLYNS